MRKFFNRVAFQTSTTGTGSVNVGAAVNDSLFTPAEAGVSDGDDEIPYLIEDGDDVEIGLGTYNTGSPPTFDRDSVTASKISGTAGTSKINLSGGATVRFVEDAEGARGTAAPDVILEHRENSGTDGGTATAGSWETRKLTHEVRDNGGICDFDAMNNQFTLDSGTYYAEAEAIFYQVGFTRVRLYDTTTPAVLLLSINGISSTASNNTPPQPLKGVITVGASQALELQSRVQVTNSGDGFGRADSFGDDEVFAQVRIWRIA